MSIDRSLAGLELVRLRRLLIDHVEARFPLQPGERVLASVGETVVRGAHLVERLREPRTEVVPAQIADGVPGGWWPGEPARRRGSGRRPPGELLFRGGGKWRVAIGDPADPLEAPFDGTVGELRAGVEIVLRTNSHGLLGSDALGGPTRGRLRVLARRDGRVRTSEIDVASAGTVLVVGSSVDAETITRARAVGVRGIIVASLGVKERREVGASERRSRSGVHGLAPFAILVLEGAMSRPIASPMMAVIEALEGRSVAIIPEPACLVFDLGTSDLPVPPDDLVRVTAGPLAGLEGSWAGLAGPNRFAGGVILEAGWVRFGTRPDVAVPLGDLERFA